jgi:hypothetical protein
MYAGSHQPESLLLPRVLPASDLAAGHCHSEKGDADDDQKGLCSFLGVSKTVLLLLLLLLLCLPCPALLGRHQPLPFLFASFSLPTQVAHIASYQPESLMVPMVLPASYLAVDIVKHSIILVVRGTTSWKDAFTDIVAHTVPFGAGEGEFSEGEVGH